MARSETLPSRPMMTWSWTVTPSRRPASVIGAAGFGIPAGVVVDEDQRRRAHIEGLADDLAGMDGGFVDRPLAEKVVQDQPVPGVEIEPAHPFMRQMRHVDVEIVEQRLPATQHRAVLHRTARHAPRRQRIGVQCRNAGIAHALDLAQRLRIGGEHRGERPEVCDQCLGKRFRIALADGSEQQEFEQFVIGQRFSTAVEQPLAQALSMAGTGMARRIFWISRQPIPHIPRLRHLHCL